MPKFSTEGVMGNCDPLQLSLNQGMLRNHTINKDIIQGVTFDTLFSYDKTTEQVRNAVWKLFFPMIFGSHYLQFNCNETFCCQKKTLLLREMLKEIVDLKNFDSILITAKGNSPPAPAMQNLVRLEKGQDEAAPK